MDFRKAVLHFKTIQNIFFEYKKGKKQKDHIFPLAKSPKLHLPGLTNNTWILRLIGITFLTTVKIVRNFYIHHRIIHEGDVIVWTFLPIPEMSLYIDLLFHPTNVSLLKHLKVRTFKISFVKNPWTICLSLDSFTNSWNKSILTCFHQKMSGFQAKNVQDPDF